jgi:hypothetical protein
MPEYIGYGFEGDPTDCHSCGQTVAESVCAGTMNRYSSPLEQFLNEGADADGSAKRAKRRPPTKKQLPMDALWPRLAKVHRQ